MTNKRALPADGADIKQDFSQLPAPVDLTRVVQTHDYEVHPPEPRSVWATPDLAEMARTNALGAI